MRQSGERRGPELPDAAEIEIGIREGSAAKLDVSTVAGSVHSRLEEVAGPADNDDVVGGTGRINTDPPNGTDGRLDLAAGACRTSADCEDGGVCCSGQCFHGGGCCYDPDGSAWAAPPGRMDPPVRHPAPDVPARPAVAVQHRRPRARGSLLRRLVHVGQRRGSHALHRPVDGRPMHGRLQRGTLLGELADRALGLDWLAFISYVNERPLLATWLNVGYSMIKKALETLKRESLTPEKTTQSLQENKEWLKSRMH